MYALLNPVNNMGGSAKWGLVSHTTAMFSLFTIPVVISLVTQSSAYIDNRRFPGDNSNPPGPAGYTWPSALRILFTIGCPISQWLADGLLVSFIPDSVKQAVDIGRSSSCIVATLSTP